MPRALMGAPLHREFPLKDLLDDQQSASGHVHAVEAAQKGIGREREGVLTVNGAVARSDTRPGTVGRGRTVKPQCRIAGDVAVHGECHRQRAGRCRDEEIPHAAKSVAAVMGEIAVRPFRRIWRLVKRHGRSTCRRRDGNVLGQAIALAIAELRAVSAPGKPFVVDGAVRDPVPGAQLEQDRHVLALGERTVVHANLRDVADEIPRP